MRKMPQAEEWGGYLGAATGLTVFVVAPPVVAATAAAVAAVPVPEKEKEPATDPNAQGIIGTISFSVLFVLASLFLFS